MTVFWLMPKEQTPQVSSMAKRVLVIGGNHGAVCDTEAVLGPEGWECTRRAKGEEALAELGDLDPDLVVVETGILDMTPSEVCARIRAATPVPVAVVKAKGSGADREALACLSRGADVYLDRPMDPDLLVARVHAQIRRATRYGASSHVRGTLGFGDIAIDLDARQVYRRDQPVKMTRKEFDLLSILALHQGQIVESGQLLSSVWGYSGDCRTRTLEVHICRLRAKLEADPANPQIIVTVPRVGYMFREAADGTSRSSGQSSRRRSASAPR